MPVTRATPGAAWPQRLAARLPQRLRAPLALLWGAVMRWIDAGGPALGAAIAFYTMFALAPLLVITIAIAGAVFGADAARGEIVGQIEQLVGTTAARAIEGMIEAAWREPGGGLATAMGVGTLLVGATGVFGELRRALNAVGQVTARTGIGSLVHVRLIAFALLLGLGFLAIASLLLSAALSAVSGWLAVRYPVLTVAARVFDLLLSVSVLGVAFAGLLRWLPDAPPSRRAVWVSALASAVLFAIGKFAIGFYLGRASVASSYGAAGSFVVVMLWVYYSSQMLLLGAALGREYDERRAGAPS